ncbi:protein CLN8-like [Chelonoidis abingdonii]|uniref:TLC domain-containing protein n=1 Tax=Chelonoidis abingdonii TaxID=106734 RepID=A0A8C0QNF1_CHEAB|nr:protein CLN8-like [Chelonoidis abingdonii]XP_032654141.1 protein CLN8-like [Chelonoidis abingdonii]
MNLANESGTSRDIYDWNYVLWAVRLKLLAAGFFIYLGVFLLAHWLSSWISASYRTLSGMEKAIWNTFMTRSLFAVQSCGAGLWALFIDPVFQADQVYSQQKWSWFHCLIAAGYFLFDNIVLHVSNIVFRDFDMVSVLHHLFAFGGILVVITNITSGHYLILVGLLLEMSSPSTCLSHVLLKTGYANTFLWKANQWVLIHMFHCRMVLSYHMLWVCISNWNDVVDNMGLPYFIVFFMGLSIFTLIINPYWTYQITERFFRLVDGNSSNTAVKNKSSGKLNSETFQKKMI